MTPFTQLTQAATCVCYERGYVVDRTGNFAACSCEAGSEWTAQRSARVAQAEAQVAAEAPAVESPDLSPVLGGPVRPAALPAIAPVVTIRPAARSADARALEAELRANQSAPACTRTSAQFSDMAMTVQGRRLTFQRGQQREVYFVRSSGEVVLLAAPRWEAFYTAQRRHIERTLAAYAARLARVVG